MHNDASDPASFVGVVDVTAADCGADVPQDGAQIEVEAGQTIAIEVEPPSGGAGIETGAHPFKAIAGFGGADEALGHGLELLQAELAAAAVQQFETQAGFAAEAPDRRWGCDHHSGVADTTLNCTVQPSFHGFAALITTGAFLRRLKA